jgi:fumarate hydratase class I
VSFELNLPLTHPTLLELTMGTRVSIHGLLLTAGPEVHRQLEEGATFPEDIPEGTVLFHCRPQLSRRGRAWDAVSVEPEISAPFEHWVPDWLANRQIRGFLGYGGFGPDVFRHFSRFTGCYLQTFYGTGPALAKYVTSAREIPFGKGLKGPDAMWALEVENFPAIVTMDLKGGNLHQLIQEGSARRLPTLGI